MIVDVVQLEDKYGFVLEAVEFELASEAEFGIGSAVVVAFVIAVALAVGLVLEAEDVEPAIAVFGEDPVELAFEELPELLSEAEARSGSDVVVVVAVGS